MDSFLSVVGGGINSSLATFFASTSGYTKPHEGLSWGWLIAALSGIAIIFSPQNANASLCGCPEQPPVQTCWRCCTDDLCDAINYYYDEACWLPQFQQCSIYVHKGCVC